jgi:PAS domain S-box-containing protein
LRRHGAGLAGFAVRDSAGRTGTVTFGAGSAAAQPAVLQPGGFRSVTLRGAIPAGFSGLVVLDATAAGLARVAVEVAPPALRTVSPRLGHRRRLRLCRSRYCWRRRALPPVRAGHRAVAQRSRAVAARADLLFRRLEGRAERTVPAQLQVPPHRPSDDRIAGDRFWEDVYVAFTQTSLWDLHSLSKPFTDSSYRPAAFYHRYDTGVELLGARLGYAAGFEHESNGKGGADSRSINILFARPTLRWGERDGWQFFASPKLYWYLDKEENDDIQRFRGYGDFLFVLEHPRSLKLAATLRAGTFGHGSILVDATYPFAKINDFFPLGWSTATCTSSFSTAGQSLLHYDERAETQFRVGSWPCAEPGRCRCRGGSPVRDSRWICALAGRGCGGKALNRPPGAARFPHSMRMGPTTKRSLRIALVYAAIAAAWVLFSDRAAAALASDAAMLVRLGMLKGWLFIVVTAALLFLLCRRQLDMIVRATLVRERAEVARSLAEKQQMLACEAAASAASRLSVAASGAHIGTWEWDMAGGRVLFDAQMHEIYGLAPGAFAGTTDAWMLLLHPDDREQVRRLNRTIADGQREFHTQFRIIRTDGQVRHVEIHAQVARDGSGRPVRVSGINLDITERVVAERRYRFLTDNISDVLWVVDTDTGCYTYVSPSIVRLRGCTPESLVGKSIEYGLSPASVALIRERMQPLLKAFLEGDPSVVAQTHDIEQIRVDGTKVWTEVATTFIRNDRGGVEIIGVTRDISARHAAEQALRASAVRLAHAEEIAGIGHWTLHIETSQVDGSDNAARLIGFPPGRRWSLAQIRDLILPEYREQVSAALRAVVEDGKPYDIVYKLRRADDGAIATVHARGERDAARRVVFGMIQDITAQRRAEEQRRLRSAALDASALSITIVDAVGCIEWVNPAFTALTGYKAEEAQGKHLNELLRSDRHSPEFYLQIQSTVAAGNTWHGEMFERRKDGAQIPVEQTVTPVRDDEGRVAHIIIIGQDISERQRLQEQVLRAQRLDSIGRLAGGIAHDLNNILSPILMAPSILRETVVDPSAREVIDTIEVSANRGAAIIRQLLTFSRGSGAGGNRLPCSCSMWCATWSP